MKNEIFFILDRSGSMSGIESDTIGGYNSFLEKQRKDEAPTSVTTILFDDRYEVLHNVRDIQDVTGITDQDYFVRGSTALLDAIGKTINSAKNRILSQSKINQPDNIIFVIITDGMENASTEYTYSSVRELINLQESEHKWEFIFLGADLKSSKDADMMGISRNKQAFYSKSRTNEVFKSVSDNITCFKMQGTLNESWADEIDESKTKKPV